MSNCTVCNNRVAQGISGGGGLGFQSGSIANCIFWGNTDSLGSVDEEAQLKTASPVNYSCIQGCSIYYSFGTGNISDDPDFVTGPSGDYYLSQTGSGQDSNSLCVDAGSDSAANLGMDLYTTRTDQVTDSGIADMGFHYEPFTEINIADINADWMVNLDDILILALQWLNIPGEPSADVAPEVGDNFVDYQDFAVVRQNWRWP